MPGSLPPSLRASLICPRWWSIYCLRWWFFHTLTLSGQSPNCVHWLPLQQVSIKSSSYNQSICHLVLWQGEKKCILRQSFFSEEEHTNILHHFNDIIWPKLSISPLPGLSPRSWMPSPGSPASCGPPPSTRGPSSASPGEALMMFWFVKKSDKIQGRDAEQAQGGEEGHGGGKAEVSDIWKFSDETLH